MAQFQMYFKNLKVRRSASLKFIRYRQLNNLSKSLSKLKVCVIGSGPAGFYTVQQLLKGSKDVNIDILERLPVPFGLVRYGVAPDHPDVKNCINAFTEAAKNERVNFFGNISFGSDITLEQLQNSYHAVILAYGAAKDRLLNIPGENLSNVLSARRFVGWYNGTPEDADLNINLDVEHVIVIGQGNVAIDVSRILLSSYNILKKTDIPEPVLEKLSHSKVKSVTMVGRRRAQDVAFTIKEAREMINLKDCKPLIRTDDAIPLKEAILNCTRQRKRLLELLHKTALEPTDEQKLQWEIASREWRLRFLFKPHEIISDKNNLASGVKFIVNTVQNDKIISTDATEILEAGLILKSIGYTSVKVDPSIPFDESRGLVPNVDGKVTGKNGLYVSGWLATGPVGVILSTMQSGFSTGKSLLNDIKNGVIDVTKNKRGIHEILEILEKKKIRPVTFDDWNALNQFEISQGKKFGKPREKVTKVSEMIEIVKKTSPQ